MDALFSAVIVGLLVFVAYKLLSSLHGYYRMCVKLRKIPSPPGHWLYGHLDKIKDSATYMSATKEFVNNGGSRMYCIWIGPFPVVGVTHAETIKQVMKQEDRKAKGQTDGYRILLPWLGDGILLSEGKKWERNRKLLTPAFHFDILRGYTISMNKASNIFLERIGNASLNGKPFDIFPFACKLTLDVMVRCSLSYDGADAIQDEKDVPYIVAVRRLSEMMWLRMLKYKYMFDCMFKWTALGREHKQLTEFVHNFTGNIIESRREKLESGQGNETQRRHLDFLDILLTARDAEGHGLTRQEIQDEVDTFTFEGHDTTASGLSWISYALGKYPELQERVYEDVCNVLEDRSEVHLEDIARFDYLPLFVKESMRLYSPVPIVARGHSEPIIVDGIEVPPGPRIDINILALHHNSSLWDDFETFNPDRFVAHGDHEVYSYLPFSAGNRNCIGQTFALNELKIATAKLVKSSLSNKNAASIRSFRSSAKMAAECFRGYFSFTEMAEEFQLATPPCDVFETLSHFFPYIYRYKVGLGSEEPVFQPDVVLRSSNGIKITLSPRE